jgi:uncharacterized protein (TIGR03435 family)
MSLGTLIRWAFGYQHWEVVGPNWRERPTDIIYEVIAKSAGPATEAQLKRITQSLIKDRLALTYHLETRDLPVFALVVARGGPKFKKSETTGDTLIRAIEWPAQRFERISMAQFVQTMDPPWTSRHVIDETGLTGIFDFTLDLRPYIVDPETGKPILNAAGAIDQEAALLQALPPQLGLRLERKIAPTKVMVIDHVEKDPTAN